MESLAYKEGEFAHMTGLERDDNPYDVGTQEYEDWEDGWWYCDYYEEF